MHDEDCQLPSLDWLTDSGRTNSIQIGKLQKYSTNANTTNSCRTQKEQIDCVRNVDFSKEEVKPPYSYAELITQAMRHHGNCKVLLSDIYEFVRQNFAWYRRADVTWQNSIRHNLSLNKQFVKLPRREGERGKGSYWMLDLNAEHSPSRTRKAGGAGASTTHPKNNCLEKCTKPKVNPAVISFLKKQCARNEQLTSVTSDDNYLSEHLQTNAQSAELTGVWMDNELDQTHHAFNGASLCYDPMSAPIHYQRSSGDVGAESEDVSWKLYGLEDSINNSNNNQMQLTSTRSSGSTRQHADEYGICDWTLSPFENVQPAADDASLAGPHEQINVNENGIGMQSHPWMDTDFFKTIDDYIFSDLSS